MKVLITGANGHLGQGVVKVLFRDSGYRYITFWDTLNLAVRFFLKLQQLKKREKKNFRLQWNRISLILLLMMNFVNK